MPDFIRLQIALVRQNVEQIIDNSQRMAQLTAQVAQDTGQTLMGQPARDRSAV
jgi:hypothetical protein